MMNSNLNVLAMVAIFVGSALLTAADEPCAQPLETRIAEWGGSLEIDTRVIREIDAFDRKGKRLPSGYADAVAHDLRAALLRAHAEMMRRIASGQTEPFVEVTYPEPGFARSQRPAADDPVIKEFEEGFVRTEGVAFIRAGATTAREVMRIYVSKDFRRGVSSRVARLWDDGDLDCIETSGVTGLMSPTQCCNRVDQLIDDGVAAEHAQVVSNAGGDYQPFFFKESLKAFVELPDGVIAVHYINYSRSVKLGRIKRSLGTGKIRESQERRFEALQEYLDAHSE